MSKKRILFICLGNICRSPTAEAVFKKQAFVAGQATVFEVDSAGTAGHHVGESSDPRSIRHAEKRGYKMDHLARQFKVSDFKNFDLLICMDDQNYRNIVSLAQTDADRDKIKKMASYLTQFNDTYILDPWALGPDAFEHVIDLLEDGCANLLAEELIKV